MPDHHLEDKRVFSRKADLLKKYPLEHLCVSPNPGNAPIFCPDEIPDAKPLRAFAETAKGA
jgi:hypothetical protein